MYPLRDFGDKVEVVEEDEAEFFGLYGFITSISGSEFAVCIGDYDTRVEAELIAELLGF